MSLNKKPSIGDLVLDLVTNGKAQIRRYLARDAGSVLAFDASGNPVAGTAKSLTIVGAGTAYTLTATAAALDLGTTDPVITVDQAGTYLVSGWAVLNYVGATFASDRTFTLKLRRTNNTAADLTGGTAAFGSGIYTTTTLSKVIALPPTIYTTTRTDDALTIFGDVSVVPSAGSVTVSKAQITAIRVR